jgi:predicted nucleic acid-binding protein
VIGIDTSVVVRYLVGSPQDQALQAAGLIDDERIEVGVSVVALADCAHVLRTQYGIEQRAIVDALIDFVQRANVRVVDAQADVLAAMLVRARSMPGRPIPDAMIVAAMAAADAIPLATFDRDQARCGVATREP